MNSRRPSVKRYAWWTAGFGVLFALTGAAIQYPNIGRTYFRGTLSADLNDPHVRPALQPSVTEIDLGVAPCGQKSAVQLNQPLPALIHRLARRRRVKRTDPVRRFVSPVIPRFGRRSFSSAMLNYRGHVTSVMARNGNGGQFQSGEIQAAGKTRWQSCRFRRISYAGRGRSTACRIRPRAETGAYGPI